MVNKVTLIGNLGKDVETSRAPSGTVFGKFSLATTETIKGEKKTEWHNIVVVGKTAENCAAYIGKGSTVYIDGRINYRSWDDQNGNKRYMTEIFANQVKFLSRKKEGQSGYQNQQNPPQGNYNGAYGNQSNQGQQGDPYAGYGF